MIVNACYHALIGFKHVLVHFLTVQFKIYECYGFNNACYVLVINHFFSHNPSSLDSSG